MTRKSGEHMVVLAEGGAAVRVRTVKRKPQEDRWDSQAIESIKATPRCPNPKDASQGRAESQRDTKGAGEEQLAEEVKGEGNDLPPTEHMDKEAVPREFRITNDMVNKYGFTVGCRGCEHIRDGRWRTGHSVHCRKRIEDRIRSEDGGDKCLRKRDEKRW